MYIIWFDRQTYFIDVWSWQESSNSIEDNAMFRKNIIFLHWYFHSGWHLSCDFFSLDSRYGSQKVASILLIEMLSLCHWLWIMLNWLYLLMYLACRCYSLYFYYFLILIHLMLLHLLQYCRFSKTWLAHYSLVSILWWECRLLVCQTLWMQSFCQKASSTGRLRDTAMLPNTTQTNRVN